MPGSVHFSFKTEFDIDTLPATHTVVQAATEFLKEIKIEWPKGKQFAKEGMVVHTFNCRKGDDFWMARISHHRPPGVIGDEKGIAFEVFKKYILENHIQNEMHYNPLLESYRTHEDEPKVIPKNVNEWKGIDHLFELFHISHFASSQSNQRLFSSHRPLPFSSPI